MTRQAGPRHDQKEIHGMNNINIKSSSASIKRLTSLLLAAVMLFTSIQFGAGELYAADADDYALEICHNGEKTSSVTVREDSKLELSASMTRDGSEYQWQIAIDRAADAWVNISGQTSSTVKVSYAMVGSLLDESGAAYIRLREKRGDEVYYSDPVKVQIAYVVKESAFSADAYYASDMSIAVYSALRTGAVPLDYETYNITVEYKYETGAEAAGSLIANIAAGGDYQYHVEFPIIPGYLAYLGDATEASLSLDINVKNISEDITYTVLYKPTEVEFKIYRYIQNVLNDNYTLLKTDTGKGVTGTLVGDDCAVEIDGFTLLYYDKDVTIAADGSTEIEIYYDRNYYLIYFDLDGGYGTEPVYTRYGATAAADQPTRAGYVFKGWELIECGGVAATDEQKNSLKLEKNGTVTVPSMNLRYKAIWETAETTYTVVYWTENANDENYSFLDSKTVSAMSASKVNGADTPHTWDESRHFTLNEKDTNNGKIVEGDGSTVVNVYYDRKEYTLVFANTQTKVEPSSEYLICSENHTHVNYSGNESGKWPNYKYMESCYGILKLKITAKYGANLTKYFFPDATSMPRDWYFVPDCNTYTYGTGNQIASVDIMPGENLIFRYHTTWTGAPVYYYLETLDGISGELEFDGRQYNLYKSILMSTSVDLTYSEEFHDVEGFRQGVFKYDNQNYTTQFDKDHQVDASASGNFLLYYRNSYYLKYYNYDVELKDKEKSLQYEAVVGATYNITPDYPSDLPKDAYEFKGWYTTPECFDGTEFSFGETTMPAHDVQLYAKWVPKQFTVRVYLTEDALNSGDEPRKTQKVDFNKLAKAPDEKVNGSYIFDGWFYYDHGEKKAWDFDSMTVTHNIDIFAQWSSRELVDFTVYYVVQNDDGTTTRIAKPTSGKKLDGMSQTFSAKVGNELYADYREGYFPNVNSHTILMKSGENTFTFVYKPNENVPYKVKYIDKDTGEELREDKSVSENNKVVVTEKFEQIDNYVPDAYQKRLVLSAEGDNVLIFYYTKLTTDEQLAPYIITHWVQGLDGDYTEYSSSQSRAKVGTDVSASSLTLDGYNYVGYEVNRGERQSGTASGTLTADGLRLDLYYDRVTYRYTVKYLKFGTDQKLLDDKTPSATYMYGTVVTEEAPSINGYKLVSASPKSHTIRSEGNVIIFYYSEESITIKYVPIGGGTVSISSESVSAVSGTPNGSVPTPNTNFVFVGWYTDEACTKSVSSDWVDASGKIVPQKKDGLHVAATYYAKFVRATTSLTVKKSGAQDIDKDQTFIFRVVGTDEFTSGIDITITVHGNGQTTIADLPVGQYKVTELADWSWRYDANDGNEKTVTLNQGTNETVFNNERNEWQWLDGDSYCDNLFKND